MKEKIFINKTVGCICGNITFKVKLDEVPLVFNCHCIDCRKKIGGIISSVEGSQPAKIEFILPKFKTNRNITKTICRHAALIANELKAAAICTLTNSGYTGWQISSWRPNCLVLVFTSNKRILSQLNLLWGVKGVYYNKLQSTDKTVEDVNALALKNRYVKKGDTVVNLAAMPIKEMGQVNTLRITQV